MHIYFSLMLRKVAWRNQSFLLWLHTMSHWEGRIFRAQTGTMLGAAELSSAGIFLQQRTWEGRILLCMGCLLCTALRNHKTKQKSQCFVSLSVTTFKQEQGYCICYCVMTWYGSLGATALTSPWPRWPGNSSTDVHVWDTLAHVNIPQEVNNSVDASWHSKTNLYSFGLPFEIGVSSDDDSITKM